MTIPSVLVECAEQLHDWGCSKLTAGEGFSVLMLSLHPDGKRGTKYCFDSVQEALAAACEQISESPDMAGYVLCYDVTVSFDSGPQRGFLFQLEERLGEGSALLFRASRKDPDCVWRAEGSFVLLETGTKKLAPPACGGLAPEPAAGSERQEPVTAPGLPPGFPEPETLVTEDCIRPPGREQ